MIRWSTSSAVSSSDDTTQRLGIEDAMKDDHQEVFSCPVMTMMRFDKNRESTSLSEKDKRASFPWLMVPPCSKVSIRSISEETSKTNATNNWSSSATLKVVDSDNHLHDSVKQEVRNCYDSARSNKMKKMVEKNNLANSKKFKKIDARKIRDPDDVIRYECQRCEVSNHNENDEDHDDHDQNIDDSIKRRRRLGAIFSRQKQSPMVMKLR